ILSLLICKLFFDSLDEWQLLVTPIFGAALSSLLGMYGIQKLTKKYSITSDSALCFVLTAFFGVALVILSCVQGSYPTLYKELQAYLFGQAATQTTIHIVLFGALAFLALLVCIALYRPIKAVIFDPEYAKAIGINVKAVQAALLGVTVLAVVIGIRSLGVVLMSAMFIFPAVASRLWTARLEIVLLLASVFGLISGFFGVYFSHEMSQRLAISFPTGPMIVVAGAIVFVFSSLLSPERGLVFRYLRRFSFHTRCKQENLLKALWKVCSAKNLPLIQKKEIAQHYQASSWTLSLLLLALQRKGWVKKFASDTYELTASGMLWGRKIVRLHRLWEVYLVEYCGFGKDRVHPSAEEMEHIITPAIERELEVILHNPQKDPHSQPIPTSEVQLLKP
ncbi:MAG: metal ABC transporter permease, partial [Chlamydiales bacterium]|nr:metal ABC transporter permease [Chlamydiales bacterium]